MSASPGPARWTRLDRLLFGTLAAGTLASLPITVVSSYDATDIDASMYIVMARSLARGEGYRYLGAPFQLHPPGMPALLVPIIGTMGTNFLALNLMGCLFGVAAVLLLFVHQRERVGGILALITGACLWLDPGFRHQCNQVMSDVPGLALLLLGLLLERRAARSPSWRRDVVLGLVIGLSAYVRFANILLVPAILVARTLARLSSGKDSSGTREAPEPWSRFLSRRLAIVAVVAWAVVLPWSVRNAIEAPPPPSDQTLLYTISTAMWHTDPGDPRSSRFTASEILSRPRTNARPLRDALGSGIQSPSMDDTPSRAAGRAWGIIAAALAIGVVIVLVRRREAAEIYAVEMALVFLFYFTFATRLALPLYVIGLAAAVEVLGLGLRRILPEPQALAGVGLLAACFVVANFAPRTDPVDREAEHRRYLEIAAATRPLLTPDDRLASTRGPRFSVYLDRPVYSLRHAIRRAGRVDAAEGIIDKYGIDAVVLRPSDPEDAALVPYFTSRYGAGRPAASALLWKVRPRLDGRSTPPRS